MKTDKKFIFSKKFKYLKEVLEDEGVYYYEDVPISYKASYKEDFLEISINGEEVKLDMIFNKNSVYNSKYPSFVINLVLTKDDREDNTIIPKDEDTGIPVKEIFYSWQLFIKRKKPKSYITI